MRIDSHQWVLFGFDLRTVGGLWRSAWRDVFWGQDARLRVWLDEPVLVHAPRDTAEAASEVLGFHQGGKVLAEAQRLPDERVLSFWLNLPEKAEAELESALALEVRAKSPYPPDDTSYGWRIASRLDGMLRVCVVIVSRSDVQTYLHAHMDSETAAGLEVWARVEGLDIVIPGFGEVQRETRYKARLRRMLAWGAYCLIVSILLLAVPVGLRSIQAEHYQDELNRVQRQSAEAVRLRNQLSESNERIQEIQRLLVQAGDPYVELVRLTHLLDDSVWLLSFDLRGDKLRIDGMADNAAELMQLLSEQPGYVDVRAPSAIRREQRSTQERFVLDIGLRAEVKP